MEKHEFQPIAIIMIFQYKLFKILTKYFLHDNLSTLCEIPVHFSSTSQDQEIETLKSIHFFKGFKEECRVWVVCCRKQ